MGLLRIGVYPNGTLGNLIRDPQGRISSPVTPRLCEPDGRGGLVLFCQPLKLPARVALFVSGRLRDRRALSAL